MDSSVAIVGYGALGHALQLMFQEAVVYDEPLGIGSRDEVNQCRFAFVAVPTPERADGACDVSVVEDVVRWLEVPHIVVLSTVSVGTTERLVQVTGKRVVHQPTYGPGHTPAHPFSDLRSMPWVILGGERHHTVPVVNLYKTVYSAEVSIWQTDARTAELTKYMENAFLALKVTFCNEMFDIATALGVDYNELRELWLLDPRIGRSHTFVYPDDRGYGGTCLPKDARALVQIAMSNGYVPHLLAEMIQTNRRLQETSAQDDLRKVEATPLTTVRQIPSFE
jgi:UDPglucose 6-dehydrogenase